LDSIISIPSWTVKPGFCGKQTAGPADLTGRPSPVYLINVEHQAQQFVQTPNPSWQYVRDPHGEASHLHLFEHWASRAQVVSVVRAVSDRTIITKPAAASRTLNFIPSSLHETVMH
jgi:hypothetical protein